MRSSPSRASIGSLIGVLVAYVASRFVGTLLYGVSPSNPALFLTLGTALTVAALMASLLPALRAARVDPVQVLRAE